MRYDISKQTAPKMPRLGKGTECVKIRLIRQMRSFCAKKMDRNEDS